MIITLLSTVSSLSFAERLATHLGVAVQTVGREQFPDGERYLRLPLADRFALVGQSVVIVGATDSTASLDDLYRLGCTAVKEARARWYWSCRTSATRRWSEPCSPARR